MKKCPKCEKEIDYYISYRVAEKEFWIYDGEKEVDKGYSFHSLEYRCECPKCESVLFTDEDEAVSYFFG